MKESTHDNTDPGRAGDNSGCWTGSVKVARPDDAAGVERVLRASYPLMAAAYEAALLTCALPVMTRASPRLLAGGSYFVAEMAKLVVGCGGWSHEKPGTSLVEPGVGHIRHFATDAAWVGRGIGRIAALDVAIGPELAFPSIHMVRAI